ncbi:MAG: hypothetical protein GC185_01930 [Alphaproteobacteria bacterium]|nr:hypothetical protein [Alphaproteobacteria bacterium]
MKYNPPVGGGASDPYIDVDPATGTEGSPVPAAAIEAPQREIVNVITSAGLTPDDADNTQLYQAIVALASAGASIVWGGTAGGTGDALTITPATAISAYSAGMQVDVIIAAVNTVGNPTANVSGVGNETIKKSNGKELVALAPGDLVAGTVASLKYDGTYFELMNLRPYAHGADVASAATLDLSAVAGDYVVVTGTTGITAVTLAEGEEITIKFASGLTITNGANLICLTGSDIATAAGDIAVFRGEAAGVVRMVDYSRASGLPITGTALIGYDSVTSTAFAALTATTPLDDTKPQITEGTQILSKPYACKSTTSKLVIRVSGNAVNSTGSSEMITALHDGSADALAAIVTSNGDTTKPCAVSLTHEVIVGSKASKTYSVRGGPASGSMNINGQSSEKLGGAQKWVMTFEEYEVGA